jgi:HEAT repeat protein
MHMPIILPLLTDPDLHVQEKALQSLFLIGQPHSLSAILPEIQSYLDSCPDPQLQQQAQMVIDQAAS